MHSGATSFSLYLFLFLSLLHIAATITRNDYFLILLEDLPFDA